MIAASTNDQTMMFRFFFSIFAILMLPFASLFLSAKFRSVLGRRRVILSLIVLLILIPSILALVAPEILDSPYGRFMHKSQKYYSQLAHGCDQVLKEHPLGTNATTLPIVGSDESYTFLKIPGNDPSLPKIIRALHPSELTISSNRVHIMVGVREFGVCWKPQETNMNSWALYVYPEGPESVVYVETK